MMQAETLEKASKAKATGVEMPALAGTPAQVAAAGKLRAGLLERREDALDILSRMLDYYIEAAIEENDPDERARQLTAFQRILDDLGDSTSTVQQSLWGRFTDEIAAKSEAAWWVENDGKCGKDNLIHLLAVKTFLGLSRVLQAC